MTNRAIEFDQFVHTLLSLFLRLLSSFFRFLLLIRIPGGVFTDMAKVSRPDLTGEEMITAEDIAEIAAFLVLRRTNAVIDEIEVHRANKAPFA